MASKKVVKKAATKKVVSKKTSTKKPTSRKKLDDPDDRDQAYRRGFLQGMKQPVSNDKGIYAQPINHYTMRAQSSHAQGWAEGRSLYNRLTGGLTNRGK
jgi:hypothetical protein